MGRESVLLGRESILLKIWRKDSSPPQIFHVSRETFIKLTQFNLPSATIEILWHLRLTTCHPIYQYKIQQRFYQVHLQHQPYLQDDLMKMPPA